MPRTTKRQRTEWNGPTAENPFVPTHVTPEMRKMPAVIELYRLIQQNTILSWTPGFYEGKIASRLVIPGGTDTMAAKNPEDRDWEKLFAAHAFHLCDIIESRYSSGYLMLHDHVADAQQLALDSPTTFSRPSAHELRKLKAGDMVKICVPAGDLPGERFWCVVHAVEDRRGGRVRAEVNNKLLYVNLKLGELVEFKIKNIYDWRPASPRSIEAVAKRPRTSW